MDTAVSRQVVAIKLQQPDRSWTENLPSPLRGNPWIISKTSLQTWAACEWRSISSAVLSATQESTITVKAHLCLLMALPGSVLAACCHFLCFDLALEVAQLLVVWVVPRHPPVWGLLVSVLVPCSGWSSSNTWRLRKSQIFLAQFPPW